MQETRLLSARDQAIVVVAALAAKCECGHQMSGESETKQKGGGGGEVHKEHA